MTFRATRLLSALIIVALAPLLAACPGSGDDNGRSSGAPSSAQKGGQSENAWGFCEEISKVTCVRDPSGRAVGVLYAGGVAGQSYVIWDPGGPGFALPDTASALIDQVPSELRPLNVLLLLEPWHETILSATCRSRGADGDLSSCPMGSLVSTSKFVGIAVARTNEILGSRPSVAYLQSFGSTRTAAQLSGLPGIRGVILASPGPTIGTTARDFLLSRSGAVLDTLQRACPVTRCRARLEEQIEKMVWPRPRAEESRELLLGLIAAATYPTQNSRFIRRISVDVARYGQLRRDDTTRLRLLGRQYAGISADHGLTSAMIGHLADTCPRIGGWDSSASVSEPFAAALAWMYRGCSGEWVARARPTVAQVGLPCTKLRTLLIESTEDSIIPIAVQRQWRCPQSKILHIQDHLDRSDATSAAVARWLALLR